MQLSFIVGKEIKYQTRINYTHEELFGNNGNNSIIKIKTSKGEPQQKFKIPINVLINIF
jgi:hypothetical protein